MAPPGTALGRTDWGAMCHKANPIDGYMYLSQMFSGKTLMYTPLQRISSVTPIITPITIDRMMTSALAFKMLGRKYVDKGKIIGQNVMNAVNQGRVPKGFSDSRNNSSIPLGFKIIMGSTRHQPIQ